jgi:hypothetical protein
MMFSPFIPSGPLERGLLIMSVALGGAVFFCRAQLIDSRFGTGGWESFLMLLTCVLAVFFPFHLLITVRYISEPKGHSFPLFFLISVLLFAWVLPVPPLYEEKLFLEHRAEFEELVAIVQAGQLTHSQACNAKLVFEPPPGFETLIDAEDCIYADLHPSTIIEFPSAKSTVKIVFLEDPASPTSSYVCYGGGQVRARLDEHWYLCRYNML